MKKILVVDDTNAEFIKRLDLNDMGFNEKNGYEVHTSLNGLAALELVRKNDYLFILMDGHLGVMSGPEVVEEIRKLNPTVPIIMLSSDDSMNKRGMEMGANAFMSKIEFGQDAQMGGEEFKEILKEFGVKL